MIVGWRPDNDEWLRLAWGKQTTAQLARDLKRTEGAVHNRAYHLFGTRVNPADTPSPAAPPPFGGEHGARSNIA